MSNHPYQALPIDDRVKRVLLTTPLIDGHNDLPQQPRAIFHGKIHNNPKFDLEKGFQRGMTDIPRLRKGTLLSSEQAFKPHTQWSAECLRCRWWSVLVRLRAVSQIGRELLDFRVLGYGAGCDRAN